MRCGQRVRQLTRLMHLGHDVATADELSVHVELRVSGPIRIFLQSLAYFRIRQDVEGLEGDPFFFEDLHDGIREAAGRKLPGSLHEEHHLVRLEKIFDSRSRVVRHGLSYSAGPHLQHADPRLVGLSAGARGQRERVDVAFHQLAKRGVDHLVLLYSGLAFEQARDDQRPKVIAGTGQVGQLDVRVGKRCKKARSDSVGVRHPFAVGYEAPPGEAMRAS